jgi:hypothetical protein
MERLIGHSRALPESGPWVSSLAAGTGLPGQGKGKTRGEYEENTKRIRREYEGNTKTTPEHRASIAQAWRYHHACSRLASGSRLARFGLAAGKD